jgi:hypothetical protein
MQVAGKVHNGSRGFLFMPPTVPLVIRGDFVGPVP